MIKKEFENRKSFKAFSLIELSIVILVIAILVAAVYEGKELVGKSKLSIARSLTESSPISGIKNLVLWFETSMEDSVVVAADGTVTKWKDRNPQSLERINAYLGTRSTNAPDYVENGVNGLPTLRFNGENQSIDIDPNGEGLNAIVQSDYTIFIAFTDRSPSKVASGGANYLLSGSNYSGERNTNLHLGNWFSEGYPEVYMYVDLNQSSNDAWMGGRDYYPLLGYMPNGTTFISTFKMSSKEGMFNWLNGTKTINCTETNDPYSYNPFEQLISYEGPSLGIGGFDYGYFGGDISEFIVFNRALKDEERKSVEHYLTQKYNVTRETVVVPWSVIE